MRRATIRIALAALGVLAVAAPAAFAAQRGAFPTAAQCPYCGGDPELMASAGVVSHGPLALGSDGSEALQKLLPEYEWRFLETQHLRWASSLPNANLSAKERKRLEPELERLRILLPSMPRKVKSLDPWLRLHLLAMRGEEFYARFQSLLGVSDADFAETRAADGPFMGDGRYLGEKDKFEVVLHERRASHEIFTRVRTGVKVTDALRWHSKDPHKLILSAPCEDGDLREDRWLWPYLVHNLSHMLLAAYKHFSYDPPVWLDEGLAHAMEKEAEPESWTREGEEGAYRERGRSSNWPDRARELAGKKRAPALAELLRRNTVGEFSDDEHVAIWAAVRHLLDAHSLSFARFLGEVSGQLDERGYPSGRDLVGLQRRALREIWEWAPADLDSSWQAAFSGKD
ncbi:MAG TPA: hypothetical protein VGC54_14610 [Planctomycetota bacterium]